MIEEADLFLHRSGSRYCTESERSSGPMREAIQPSRGLG